MPSNIDDVIDSIDKTKDDLHDNTRDTAVESMERVKGDADKNLKADAEWTGRTSMALNTSFERFSRGKFNAAAWVNRATSPYARVVEMGSGRRGRRGEIWSRSRHAGEPDNYPEGYPYDAPEFSEELVENILDWIETKPIMAEEDPPDLAREIAGSISNVGTFAHPFMRPAWQDNVELIKSDFERAVRRSFE